MEGYDAKENGRGSLCVQWLGGVCVSRVANNYIGIDLGFSNVVVAYYDGIGKTGVACEFQEGGRLSPAFISFEDGGRYIVGKSAKENAVLEPEKTVGEFKRFIGENDTLITIEGKSYKAEDLLEILLKYVVHNANEYLETVVEGAVITVPNSFGDEKRRVVVEAGKRVGLREVILLDESTAAIYHNDAVANLKGMVATLDLGGSTFDVTVASISDNTIDVVGLDGDGKLGGKDWDNALKEYVKSKYLKGKSLSIYDEQQLDIDIEKAKIALTNKEKTRLIVNSEEDKQSVIITREEFEKCTKQLLNRAETIIRETFREIKPDKIYMVGGATKMPQFREMISQLFPDVSIATKDPDEAVARGAAVYAQLLLTKERVLQVKELKNISAHGYGIEVLSRKRGDKRVYNLIKKGESLPKTIERVFYTGDDDSHKEIGLKIYETKGIGDFSAIDEKGFLGMVKIEKGGELKKYSPVTVYFTLDADGILSVRGMEPKWETAGHGSFTTK